MGTQIRLPRRRSSNGSLLGTHWKSNDDEVKVTWPTLFGAVPFGFFGLLFCLIFGSVKSYEFISRGTPYGWWLPVLICGGLVSLLILSSAWFLRERFSISATSATCSRWPAILHPRQAVPRKQVINAVVRLQVLYGKRTRRIGQVSVRVRRADGIDWWQVGRDMTWSEAQRLGQELAQSIEVKYQESS